MAAEYIIIAQVRASKRRMPITEPMPKEKAKEWAPTPSHRVVYRYFKVEKYNPEDGRL